MRFWSVPCFSAPIGFVSEILKIVSVFHETLGDGIAPAEAHFFEQLKRNFSVLFEGISSHLITKSNKNSRLLCK